MLQKVSVIARAHRSKAQVISARSKENVVFYNVNMSTKSKTDTEFSRVSFGDFFFLLNLAQL